MQALTARSQLAVRRGRPYIRHKHHSRTGMGKLDQPARLCSNLRTEKIRRIGCRGELQRLARVPPGSGVVRAAPPVTSLGGNGDIRPRLTKRVCFSLAHQGPIGRAWWLAPCSTGAVFILPVAPWHFSRPVGLARSTARKQEEPMGCNQEAASPLRCGPGCRSSGSTAPARYRSDAGHWHPGR